MSTSEQRPSEPPPNPPETPPAKRTRPTHARPRAAATAAATAQPAPYQQSTYSNVKQAQADVGATADEMRAFIARTRGKSPQEVLGMIAQSGLFKSTALATCLVFGLLVLLTVLPYSMGYRGKQSKPDPVASETNTADNTSTDAANSNNPATANNTSATPTDNNTTSSGDPALKALGIDETETADPNKNPLEDSLDDLLDNVK